MIISPFAIYCINVLDNIRSVLFWCIVFLLPVWLLLSIGFYKNHVQWHAVRSLFVLFLFALSLYYLLPTSLGMAAMTILPQMTDRATLVEIEQNPELARLQEMAQIWLERQHERILEK